MGSQVVGNLLTERKRGTLSPPPPSSIAMGGCFESLPTRGPTSFVPRRGDPSCREQSAHVTVEGINHRSWSNGRETRDPSVRECVSQCPGFSLVTRRRIPSSVYNGRL